MSYESYEQPYEEYDPNRQPYYEQPYEQRQYEQQQYEQQPYEQQPYEQYRQPYEQQYEQPQPGYEGQYQDQQWAQSGLGWEQQAWDDARLGVPYAQVNELSGTDFPQYQAELPRDLPVPDYPPEYQRYPAHQAPGEYQEYAAEPASGFPRQRADQASSAYPDAAEDVDSPDAVARPAAAGPEEKPVAKPGSASANVANAANAQGSAGRGAFGAAGIGVVTAIAAVASSGALLVVVALIQLGVALGWQQAVGEHEKGRVDRRATAITALIGWAATAAAFKLALNNDFLGLPVTLGVGFLLLAADQTMRRGRSLGDGERVAGLGISVAGGLFAVLPAGFVIADRADPALTAACASAAALGVLCCALLGRDPVRGIGAGLLLGAVVGAFAAKALQADGGLQAGALGGAVAALAAATAVGAMDRIVAEAEARGSIRIVSQTLPVALAAVGALIASAVFR